MISEKDSILFLGIARTIPFVLLGFGCEMRYEHGTSYCTVTTVTLQKGMNNEELR